MSGPVAFVVGSSAHRAGVTFAGNPYPARSMENLLWSQGWRFAEREAKGESILGHFNSAGEIWTDDQILVAIELRRTGSSVHFLSRVFGRTPKAIRGLLGRHGVAIQRRRPSGSRNHAA